MERHISQVQLQKRIKLLLGFFIFGLTISGLTAIPLKWEINLLDTILGNQTIRNLFPLLFHWFEIVRDGILNTLEEYPFIAYGTDWLAFGHIIIAINFIGPFKDPVRNIWVIELGMIACILVIPWALTFGALRGIPFFWRIIDCSFGVFGIIPLYYARKYTLRLSQN